MKSPNPEERIDAALDSVLKATGSALKIYQHSRALQERLAAMREAMRKIMSDEYTKGMRDSFK